MIFLTVQAVCASAQTPNNTTQLLREIDLERVFPTAHVENRQEINVLICCKGLLTQFSMYICRALATVHLNQNFVNHTPLSMLELDWQTSMMCSDILLEMHSR